MNESPRSKSTTGTFIKILLRRATQEYEKKAEGVSLIIDLNYYIMRRTTMPTKKR